MGTMMIFKNILPALCVNLLLLLPPAKAIIRPTAAAIYCFGDSIFDSGNNNYLPMVSKANFTPYGVDFINGPTGRFTNNRTVVDVFAQKLRLPFAPPYLRLVREPRFPLTGVNYASASCGILDETGKRLGPCLPLRKQVDYFEETVMQLKKQYPLLQLFSRIYLANSIFVISIGSNDYFNNYLQPDFYNTSSLTPDQFAQLLVDGLSRQLSRLYNLGARKFVVFDIGPLGCIPAVVASTNTTGPCNDQVNGLISLYNQRLAQRLRRLQTNLLGSKITFGASYNLSLNINLNPTQYGLQAANIPCCAVSNSGECIPGGSVCSNRNVYRSFDAIHPTDAVYRIFANRCFDQSPSICSPLTVKQLAQA